MAGRSSLKNRRATDGPIQRVPENQFQFDWVSSLNSSAHAVCVGEGSTQLYVGRCLGQRSKSESVVFGVRKLPIGNNNGCVTNYEILTDPHQKAEWKEVTGVFQPDSCNAIIANHENRHENDMYIGKVTYQTGDCAIGTIQRSTGTWKLRHLVAPNYDIPKEIILNGAGYTSCEVLCEKNDNVK